MRLSWGCDNKKFGFTSDPFPFLDHVQNFIGFFYGFPKLTDIHCKVLSNKILAYNVSYLLTKIDALLETSINIGNIPKFGINTHKNSQY